MQDLVHDTYSDITISKAITNLKNDIENTKRELKAGLETVNARISAVENRIETVEGDNTEIKTITSQLEKQLQEVRDAHYYNIANKLFQLLGIVLIIIIIVYLIS